MATSPNFNWPEPDNTDLVKNGALAIRTAVNAIDTSLVDLKGGTTGQVLTKASNTDMDFSWVADATGIPATIFDAKGDIIAATAADTASRLAVGANNTVLTADSSTATGLKWAAATGTTIDTFGVNKTSSQSPTTAVATKITFNNEEWDTGNNFASSTFTATETGYWQFSANIRMYQTGANANHIRVYKNGSWIYTIGAATDSSDNYNGGAFIVSLATNDTVELYAYMEGTSPVINGSTTIQAIFQGHKIK